MMPARRSCTLLAVAVAALAAAVAAPRAAAATVDPAVRDALARGSATTLHDVIVVLRHQAAAPAGGAAGRRARLAAVEASLRQTATDTQRPLRALLERRRASGQVRAVTPFWIFNGLRVVATRGVVRELAVLPAVGEIQANETIPAPATTTSSAAPEPNVELVGAPALWSLGLRGQGAVVASMDTGVDASHPDLAGRWRGGANSWYDPNGEHPTTPVDVNGHGTWTTGVMVGGDAGGSAIGVAPDARWIAVKLFNDRGSATTAGIHAGFQWLLDPDRDPATADAPHVVNNSWSMVNPGCDLTFQLDLRNLRAAGILPVFAAGNGGPASGTSLSPGNNPEAFAVGDTTLGDQIDPSSSRGPSSCGQPVYPQLVAPGVDIRTTDRFGFYTSQSGTSMAAPHVAGALALLLGAFPGADAGRQEAALEQGGLDLGDAGPDTTFGYGRLDALASYHWLATAPDFTLTAAPGSATAAAGATASYSVAVASVNGFSGDVTLALEGLSSSQASWTFTPGTLAGGSGSSQLSVAVAPSTPPGTYPLTIRATSGGLSHVAAVSLVVPAPPDFSLAATPASASTLPGGSVAYTVTVSGRNGFAADVALSLSGLPSPQAGATFQPGTVAGGSGSSQLTVSTSAALPPGSYPLTVTGTSGGLSHSATLTLVVTAAPDFALSVAPASATVVAGLSTTYTVTVSSLGGFAAPVSLSVSSLPSAATGSFSPNPVGTPGKSTLTIRTARYTTRGTFTIRITGKSGTLVHQATATLVVRS